MSLFGTDGLRGRAGEFPLDARSVRTIGGELGRRSAQGNGPVVIGGDTRESTRGLVTALAGGIADAGGEFACAGTITTPAIAELVLALRASAGVSVSASHNPWQDNGIKIFGPDGKKWPDASEKELESVLLSERESGDTADGEEDAGTRGRGDAGKEPEADPRLAERYLERLAERVPANLNNIYIVIDAGNGAAFRLAPAAFERAGGRVASIHARPDGHNINADCGALHPESMAIATRERGAAMGVAYDGDADRSIFADETGRVLDGDDVLWIIATVWKRRGALPAGGVVGTVMSNYGLEAALAREDIPFARSAVGDRNVARLMEERGAALGGEASGHILLPDSPAGDGIATSLLLARILVETGESLSRLATLEKVPQKLRNVRVAHRVPFAEVPRIASAVARAERSLEGRGRVYLRYSGTEPLLRILVEGFDAEVVAEIAEDLESVVRAELA
jgi:phosphoglucosamine mutase